MLFRSQASILGLLALSSAAQETWVNNILRRQLDVAASAGIKPPLNNPSASASATPMTPALAPVLPEPSPSSATPLPVPPPPSTTSSFSPGPTTSQPPLQSTSSLPPTASQQELPKSTPSVTKGSIVPAVIQSPIVIRITRTETVSGQVFTTVSETISSVPIKATNIASSDGESSSGGMSSKTKTTIIGVVVGIGGAILLGGLGVVAWRIWGRKKSEDEGADFVDYSRPETGTEKTGSANGGAANPFQSTLEKYHNPAARVNASSNF